MFDADDTIAALASPPGGAARAIVRVSGPNVLACVERCFVADDRRPLGGVRRPTALPGQILIEGFAAPLPGVLYLWPSSRSYTRQPTAEFHTIGSPPLVEALLAELGRHGARPARPGEFTLRAFLAGRIDLTQAEAVLGVIDARGRQELETALAQLAGGLAQPLRRLRGTLLDLLAHLEAGLDFVEEEIEFISRAELAREVAAAQDEVERLVEQAAVRGESATAVRAVLVGAPNVGKSALYNALTGEQALVSDHAGTTRDYLSARIDLGGVTCELFDTAGRAQTWHHLDAAAQEATRRQWEQADIELLCFDAARPLTPEESAELPYPSARPRIVVLTKVDQPRQAAHVAGAVETSSHTGAGLDQLRERLRQAAGAGEHRTGVVPSTAARCSESLRQAALSLAEARHLAQTAAGDELVAAELRIALGHLGDVAGDVCTDDLLDRIFSRFCIGK
ncbi:MAG TPA: tRNA modification GTPase [Pirellulales bacterium]|nr:tRNA modification GTPase [Pirellulales bacterium]